MKSVSFLDSRALFLLHPNPKNIILHTALVGELNGFAFSCLWGTIKTSKRCWPVRVVTTSSFPLIRSANLDVVQLAV